MAPSPAALPNTSTIRARSGDVSGNIGFEPYDGAYFNMTFMVHNHGHTFKSGPEPQATNDIGSLSELAHDADARASRI